MEKDNGRHERDRTKGRILIVDDEPDTCELLEMLFQVRGYETATACNGREALQYAETFAYDLIILDIIMPDMDGLEVLKRLHEFSEIPVIFLTAVTSGENAARALQLGAADYIRKPYSTSELLVRVDSLRFCNEASETEPNGKGNNRALPVPTSIAAVIPAYNEERFIGSVVLKARKYVQTVIVIDDGSSDATAQIAEEAGAFVLSHSLNLGKAAALNTAFYLLREQPHNVAVVLDGDGQHIPEELEHVVAPVLDGQADIVIGSRYIEKKSQVPRHRIFGHWMFNWINRLASGIAVSDSQSGFRAFSFRAVKALSFSSQGFSVESEMQFIARENNLRLIEVPITVRYQDPPKRSVIAHGLAVLNGILHLVGQYRPLLFFGLPGLIMAIAGLVWEVWVIGIYSRTHQVGAGFALIGLLISIPGLVMLSTGLILHSMRGLLINLLGPNRNMAQSQEKAKIV